MTAGSVLQGSSLMNRSSMPNRDGALFVTRRLRGGSAAHRADLSGMRPSPPCHTDSDLEEYNLPFQMASLYTDWDLNTSSIPYTQDTFSRILVQGDCVGSCQDFPSFGLAIWTNGWEANVLHCCNYVWKRWQLVQQKRALNQAFSLCCVPGL